VELELELGVDCSGHRCHGAVAGRGGPSVATKRRRQQRLGHSTRGCSLQPVAIAQLARRHRSLFPRDSLSLAVIREDGDRRVARDRASSLARDGLIYQPHTLRQRSLDTWTGDSKRKGARTGPEAAAIARVPPLSLTLGVVPSSLEHIGVSDEVSPRLGGHQRSCAFAATFGRKVARGMACRPGRIR
jgi:hypothetical protein